MAEVDDTTHRGQVSSGPAPSGSDMERAQASRTSAGPARGVVLGIVLSAAIWILVALLVL